MLIDHHEEEIIQTDDVLSELRQRRRAIRARMGVDAGTPVVVIAMPANESAAIARLKALEDEAARNAAELQSTAERTAKLEAEVAELKKREAEDLEARYPGFRETLRYFDKLTVEKIMRRVSLDTGISVPIIKGPGRNSKEVRARQIAMYLAREMIGASFPEIGRRMGDRDHTTAMHGHRRIGRLIQTDPDVAEVVSRIRASL